ncbi:hypothetical protein CCMA1212_004741 [Trichoderma ghanense]|uniref:Uncharacterized protein n=1 Tax=Trichoderma ghanense TaxID=65468 RepID=A0ABY2H960_9HYPO
MSRRSGLWDSHARAESSTSQFKRESRSSLWEYPVAFAPSGAAAFRLSSAAYCLSSNANGNHRTPGKSSMSGTGGSTMNGPAPGPSNGNGDVKGKGKAPAVSHDMPLLDAGSLPPLASTIAPFLSAGRHSDSFTIQEYDGAFIQPLNRGHTPALPVPDLMSPSAPGHRASDPRSSAPFGGWPSRELPSFFGPQGAGHDGPECRCSICTSGPQAMCFQQQLAQQQASINAVWDAERTRLEAYRSRVEDLVRQEGRIILDHYRQGWDEERNRLQSEITALRNTIKGLEDGHLQLCEDHRKLWVENLKLEEDNSRLRDALSEPRNAPDQAQRGVEGTTVHHGNVQPIFTNPFELAGSGQGGRPSGHNGGRGYRSSWSAWTDPTSSSTPFARSSWPVQAPTRATSRSPPPPAATLASLGSARIELPSERCVPMSPQPEYGSRISSPVFPLYSASPTPARSDSPMTYCPASPNLARSDSPSTYCPASPDLAHLESPAPFCPASPKLLRSDSPIPFRPASPTLMRSPKRRLSVIDVNEVDAGLDGISLRADTIRRTTFAEGTMEGAPPSKRQRSLSQEYCIVNNLSDDNDDDDDEEEEEGEEEGGGRDKEEVRRLKMHAGNTPPRSPLVRHNQGSPIPLTPSSPPEGKPAMVGDVAMAESVSSASEGSGDVPLEGPLMIQNDAAEDESFLAALNEKLEPISQGVDALPRAVQPPIKMPAPVSAMRGGRLDIRRLDPDGAPRPEGLNTSNPLSNEDNGSDQIRIYLGEIFAKEQEACVKTEQPAFPLKMQDVKSNDDDDDEYSDDAKGAEADVPIKFKSTSNFGAPFGRM